MIVCTSVIIQMLSPGDLKRVKRVSKYVLLRFHFLFRLFTERLFVYLRVMDVLVTGSVFCSVNQKE